MGTIWRFGGLAVGWVAAVEGGESRGPEGLGERAPPLPFSSRPERERDKRESERESERERETTSAGVARHVPLLPPAVRPFLQLLYLPLLPIPTLGCSLAPLPFPPSLLRNRPDSPSSPASEPLASNSALLPPLTLFT